MDIIELATKYKEFYAPAFTVKVNGRDLVRELFLTVTTAEVDLKEKTAGRFSFTVANAFDWEPGAFVSTQDDRQINLTENFEFGSQVEMLLGYGDPATLQSMLKGMITEISTSFNEGGNPELTVSGFDKLHLLTLGKEAQYWEKSRDSDAVKDLVSITGLTMNIEETTPVKQRIDKAQKTSMQFIQELVENNSTTFYAKGDTFYFGPRKESETIELELEWGKGLLSFSPEANLAMQVGNVEVRGVSAEEGELIIGRASAGEETDSGSSGSSGSEQVSRAMDTDTTITLRTNIRTQEEADRLAQAILDERSQDYIQGNGESIGLPEIVPNINISIQGIGQPFSQTYYISSARHAISASGYMTSWNARQNSLQESEE